MTSDLALIPELIAQVEARMNLGCALDAQGSVWCWGLDRGLAHEVQEMPPGAIIGAAYARVWNGEPSVVARNVDEIALSESHLCIRRGGEVLCRGGNVYGQSADAPADQEGFRLALSLPGVRAIDTSDNVSCALADDGVWCWGRLGPRECPIDCGHGIARAVLDCRNPVPRRIVGMPTDDPFTDVKVSTRHMCGLTQSGALWCWDPRDAEPTPSLVETNVLQVALSWELRCVVFVDGTARCAEITGRPLRAMRIRAPNGVLDLRHPEAGS